MNALKDKVAVVTAGSIGIRLATALRFAAEGAYSFVWKLSEIDRLYETIAAKKKSVLYRSERSR